METTEVITSVGTFTLREPLAGPRNRAMIKAETQQGFKSTVFLFDLLPKCVTKRPESFDRDVPIDQVLDGLSSGDYDLLSSALNLMLHDVKKQITEEDFEQKKT